MLHCEQLTGTPRHRPFARTLPLRLCVWGVKRPPNPRGGGGVECDRSMTLGASTSAGRHPFSMRSSARQARRAVAVGRSLETTG